jgi:hypothetical protein
MGRGLLILVSGMFIVVGIVQSGINNRNTVLPQRSMNYQEELHATNVVNSGMDYALREIINNQGWTEGLSSDDYLGGASVNISVYDQGSADIPANNIPVWDQYTLLVHGVAEYEGQMARSELYLRKDSFSKYSYFTDYEPSNIYFIWSDELSGPVHSNGRFNIAGDPTFYGKVTSPQDWNGYDYMENDPNFFGGSDFNADRRDPPTMFSLDKLKNDAGSNGLSFDNEVRLEFRDNNELFVTEKTGSRWSDASQYTVDLSMYNGVISSSEEISMRGTIDGQYTVHSEDDIWINGDIRYKTDPAEDSNSSDLLGIVSEKEVIIDKDAHRQEGYSNLTIHASIMALDKSFSAEDYNSGGGRGELNLLGGIIQQRRGPMGTFSSGSIQSGFNKQYEYDKRLQRMNPPSFPRESFFSIVHWHTNTAPVSASTAQNSGEEGENDNAE